MSSPDRFVAGGAVQADRGIYLRRSADQMLVDLCQQGTFAYILSSRQVGKSSLMNRAAERLLSEGVAVAVVDLSALGVSGITSTQWYKGILSEITKQLRLAVDVSSWWESNAHISVTQRFSIFVREEILNAMLSQVVVFVDEIDSTLGLGFTDDFFAAIRYLHNARAQFPELRRLSFVLAGVATPSQLIKDAQRTPFNIGRLVELTDFTFSESLPLTDRLGIEDHDVAREILQRVLEWTGGHPYLTLRVFKALQELPNDRQFASEVDRLVQEIFFNAGPEEDTNLVFVKGMLTEKAPDKDKVLADYIAIRSGKGVADRDADVTKTWLKLSGVVLRKSGLLKVRNLIYETVFNLDWAHSNLSLATVSSDTPPTDIRIYISYSRIDGAELASRLQKDLVKRGYDAWLDRSRLLGGAVWTHTVESALDEAQCVLALLSPGSYVSEICRAEQLRALRSGKEVIPLLCQSDANVPLHLEARTLIDFSDSSSYALDFARLLNSIQQREGVSLLPRYRTTYVTAPPLPVNFVERPEALTALRDAVISDSDGRHIALTALEGMGGVGKTVLALALCHDELVQQAFPDGVIWISIGPSSGPDNIVDHMREIGQILGDDLANYTDLRACTRSYRRIVSQLAVLIVLDDVWKTSAIEPFRVESPRSRLLFTTRDKSIAAAVGAREHVADVLSEAQSREVLARWSRTELAELPPLADDLIRECGRLPLALSMVGAMLHGRPSSMWTRVIELLRRADLEKIKAQFPDYPHSSVLRAIQVSVDALEAAARERYVALAILPDDMSASVPVQQCIWGVDEVEAVETAEKFTSLSLARPDQPEGSIRLHDLQLAYARAQFPDREALPLLQGAIRLSSDVIGKDPHQFNSQMTGRLLPYQDMPAIASFTARIVRGTRTCWLRPLQPTLHPPGTALIRTLQGHTGPIDGVAMSADGRIAISASDDHTLKVWDVESGRELRTLDGHTGRVSAVAVSRDGRIAASASDDYSLKVWDLEVGRALRTLQGHSGFVRGVAISEDGRLVVSASWDATLKVWDAESGRVIRTLEGHSSPVLCVAMTGDGGLAVTASQDRTLRVWDVQSGRALRSLEGHSEVVLCVAISRDGRLAVSGSWDNALKVWDVESGRELRTLRGHYSAVRHVAMSWDQSRAVSASSDKNLKVWDLRSGRELSTLEGHSDTVCGVAVSSDGRRVVSASRDNTLKVWDVETARQVRALEGHTDWVCGVAVTADGRQLVSASADKTLKVWDGETARELRILEGHTRRVNGVAVSSDGRRAVSASEDNTLKVWDVKAGRELRTLEGHSDSVRGVAMSPDARLAVSASADKTLKVWDVETGRELRTLKGHSGSVRGVAMSPDARLAVSASADKTLKVWDVEAGRELRTLEGHSGWIYGVILSFDGRLAISASDDKTLKVWDMESGRERQTLEGHSDWVYGVAMNAGGTLLVSASKDRTVKVWDIETGAALATYTCDGSALCCAWINSHDIAAGDAAGRVQFLRFEMPA